MKRILVSSLAPSAKPDSSSGEISIEASRGLGQWLRQQNSSLLISAYQSGRLFMISSNEADDLSFSWIKLDRCMGLAADNRGFWLASLHQIWRFVTARLNEKDGKGHTLTLVPQQAIHTGFINTRDLMIGANGQPIVASCFFNCLIQVDPVTGLIPLWSPPFIEGLILEDRCHLNGIAWADGVPVFTTALSAENKAGGWREKPDAGCLMEVNSRSVIVGGLSAPHSPRIHQKRLWLLESGRGSLGYITGNQFTEILGCPGYPRGLSFKGDFAIIGLSRLREEGSGLNLPIVARLAKTKQASICGLLIVDIHTGKVAHQVQFGPGIEEIYDVAVVPEVSNVRLIQPNSKDALRSYVFGQLKTSAENIATSEATPL